MSSIDLSHHLSDVAKSRAVSPLKGIFKYIEKNPNIISVAGGVPSPAYFPFANLSADTLVASSFTAQAPPSAFSWLWSLFGISNENEKTTHIVVPKYPVEKDDINLAVALQYGTATGLEPLRNFIKEFAEKIYQPGYSDFTCLVHAGNTDGWSKAFLTLCNRGDSFLTEEWTYPSALASAQPYGIMPVAVKADAQGMRDDDLEYILSTWDESSRGMKRPRVIYTVPCGQNPTGTNMMAARKKAIYDVCVKYDVIIVEDDPYYFLQYTPYVAKHLRRASQSSVASGRLDLQFLQSLAPSYLRFDYQGRVIRMDTFSKTIAPGSRLGFFTCNPLFAERLERHGETTTQAPCGFGQSLITQLLTKEWSFTGYVRWLRGLNSEYNARRNAMLDLFIEDFHLKKTSASSLWAGLEEWVGYCDSKKLAGKRCLDEKSEGKPLVTFTPPMAGMFIWFRVHVENLPGLAKVEIEDVDTAEGKLWVKFAEGGVLMGSGMLFAADKKDSRATEEAHYRISFSNVDHATMKKAVSTIRRVIKEYE